ncbi:unnamed protein product [Camellia sinensis]
MPPAPEPVPWDRKDFFKERKHERSSDSLGSVSRWRETPHHREFRSRPPGHGKQGSWHMYPEEFGHGFTPSRSNEKNLDDVGCRPSGSRGDGKYSRNSRENRVSFSQKDWKGHSWENGNGSWPFAPGGPLDVSYQRSVDDMLTYNSHPHSDFVNTWEQLNFKDQHDKIGSVNGLGTGQRFDRENSMGSIDWKPLKWTRSGSMSSRGSGFSHSSSSKSMGVDSGEAKVEVQVRNVTPVQSPSGDAVGCATSAAPWEEASSRKKPRLGWGEGLAKYEKKKVEGPDDSATKHGMVVCGNIETLHSHILNLSDKSPRVTGLSDCASPATPSSVACSSSPGEDKPFAKAANIDNYTSNLSSSPRLFSQNIVEGTDFNLENLELTPIANLSSSIGELLQFDDQGSVDSSFLRSTAMNKLLLWKGGISKALEMTESEIDLLENELKSLISKSEDICPCPAVISSLQRECRATPCEELVVTTDAIPRPAPLLLVSSGDMIVEKAVGGFKEHGQVKDEDVDSPGTVTFKFVDPLCSAEAVTLSESVKHGESSGDLDARKSGKQEVNGSNEEKIEGLSVCEGGGQLTTSRSCAAPVVTSLCRDREDTLYDLILASNKDSANRASEVFNKLLPSGQCHIDIFRTTSISSLQNDPLIEEKFAKRKRFLRFKERVITLKFRAFQHLWKEDMRLLSIRKYRAKSQKKMELCSRSPYNGYQKHRSSIRSRFSSPGGYLSLVSTTEIINFTSKLLSDSQVKLCRNHLKMPALILDKGSSFISSNGLVEDPCAVEKERATINPWTTEEKDIFMDKLATFGKDFGKIASFLDHKTTADCIVFYYKNHKSDCFVKIKKSEFSKKGKSWSNNNYLVTSGKRWNRDTNAASLDMLGAASAIAANADDGMENQQKCTSRFLRGVTSNYRASQGDDGMLERSGSLDIFGNERETVAADVLAGIYGAISSEAMSSCTTSSVDPGEIYRDGKWQKVGSLMRWPLTPEVTQNVDNDTCSDESCGEMMDPTYWTDEEKSIFIQAVSSYGKDFTMISRCVRTKSMDQCKAFFSKARKCLGLDTIGPRSGNEGMPRNDDTNDSGSDNEDACVIEAGSVTCSQKSGSKIVKDMMLSDLNVNHFESDPAEIMNTQADINRSENNGTGEIYCEDPELQSQNMVTDEKQAEGKPKSDFDGIIKMENNVNSVLVSPDTEAGGDEANAECTTAGESLLAKEANDHGISVSGAEGDAKAVDLELEGQQTASENNLNDKQEENGHSNTSGPSDLNCSDQDLHTNKNASILVADTIAPLEFDVDHKQKKIALELNPPSEPHAISLEHDVSLVNVKTFNPDVPLRLDFEKVSDKPCQKAAGLDDYNQHQSGHSVLGCTDSSQILRGYPLQVSMKKEMNGGIDIDVDSKKLAPLQSLSKIERNFHADVYLSQECFLQKCNSSKAHSSVAQLPFLSQEQKSDHSKPPSWRSSSGTEKPSRNGDVKLFGQILTHPSSHQKQNEDKGVQNPKLSSHNSNPSSHQKQNEDKGVQNPKLSSHNSNLKINGTDSNSVPAKLDQNNHLGIENVPTRSYGFWDGHRIRTGFSTLPDSGILLAKYPAAFSNYPTSSSNKDHQQPLHLAVKSNECNSNGVTVFSNREITSSNGVADYQFYRRSQEGGARMQPFKVDMKQRRGEMLFSEMQRRNGYEAVSSIQQQGRGGMVGINVVGRGGILVGGACTTSGVSDPVAAIKMHYVKSTEQFGGQTGGIIREEESWRGKGDVGM